MPREDNKNNLAVEDQRIPTNPFLLDYEGLKVIIIPSQVAQRLDFDMNDATGAGGAIIERLITFTDGDATPSVKKANLCITAGTTAITDFDDGVIGQTIKILATGNITVTDGTPIILAGSANYTMTDTDTLTLTMFNDQIWQEVARSVN